MSRFRSVALGDDDPDVEGIDYDDRRATVDVANGWDNEIRISIEGDEVLLTSAQTERLIARLRAALTQAGPGIRTPEENEEYRALLVEGNRRTASLTDGEV